jgi:phosphatidylinositol alpha-1,6-mannosyltransferase
VPASTAVRLLFVTRKFPPAVGGMETLASSVWSSLQQTPADCRLIAFGGSQKWLPFWLPIAYLRVLRHLIGRPGTIVLCGDALLHAALSPLLRFARVRQATMVMGLDLTWPVAPYQWLTARTLRRAQRVIAISHATAAVARGRGIAPERVRVVRLAVPLPQVSTAERTEARAALRARFAIAPDAPLLVSISRLVRRKGLRWFVGNVLPKVPSAVLLIGGDGPDHDAIAREIASAGVGDRCHILGRVDDAAREELLRGADIFVQPNIAVPGDIEGFGLVAVEAAGRGAIVLAADLEGLKDAVVDQRTGFLLRSEDARAWQAALIRLTGSRSEMEQLARQFQRACHEHFDFATMGRDLLSVVSEIPTASDRAPTPP